MWFDMPRNLTLEFEGVREVPIKTTGSDKVRFTVVLGRVGGTVSQGMPQGHAQGGMPRACPLIKRHAPTLLYRKTLRIKFH